MISAANHSGAMDQDHSIHPNAAKVASSSDYRGDPAYEKILVHEGVWRGEFRDEEPANPAESKVPAKSKLPPKPSIGSKAKSFGRALGSVFS